MRLIDADTLVKEMNKRAEEDYLDFRDCRDMIEYAPEVPAISIDFLKEKIAECVRMRDAVNDNVAAYERWNNDAWCLTELLESWEENQQTPYGFNIPPTQSQLTTQSKKVIT